MELHLNDNYILFFDYFSTYHCIHVWLVLLLDSLNLVITA